MIVRERGPTTGSIRSGTMTEREPGGPHDEMYSIGEVAALLGVSTHTIRAWERRHDIVKPVRTQTRQRRYRGRDVELLRDVKRAIDLKGLSLRVAAQAAHGAIEPAEEPRQAAPAHRAVTFGSGNSDLWRTIAEFLPQLMLVVDEAGTIIDTNVAVARALGVVRQRLRGRKFIELVDPFDRDKASLLYRPQPRTTSHWELNISTGRGPRLYSFQTWRVQQQNTVLLAMVGNEMFPEARRAEEAERRVAQPLAVRETMLGGVAVITSLKNLLDRLPFGVAVITIGSDPRVVYANASLCQVFHVKTNRSTGVRLRELLPNPVVTRALREAVRSRRHRMLRLVRRGDQRRVGQPGVLDLAFRPMFSSSHKVTGALLVLNREWVVPPSLATPDDHTGQTTPWLDEIA